jgi:hypothetical protein
LEAEAYLEQMEYVKARPGDQYSIEIENLDGRAFGSSR